MDKRIKTIAEHFDSENQKKKLHEEVCEMICSDAFDDDKEFTQEAADVIILITQRLYQRGISEDDLMEQIDFKLDRTIDRIRSKYYE